MRRHKSARAKRLPSCKTSGKVSSRSSKGKVVATIRLSALHGVPCGICHTGTYHHSNGLICSKCIGPCERPYCGVCGNRHGASPHGQRSCSGVVCPASFRGCNVSESSGCWIDLVYGKVAGSGHRVLTHCL